VRTDVTKVPLDEHPEDVAEMAEQDMVFADPRRPTFKKGRKIVDHKGEL